MSNILTEVRLALIARLETITTANGYLTNVGGNVKSGWFNEVVKETPPGSGLVVLQRAPDGEPLRGAEATKFRRGFRVVAGVDAGLDTYEAALEDIEADLLRCLLPTQGQHITWLPKGCSSFAVGKPDAYPPGDGQPAATVLLPIHIDVILHDPGL